MKRQKWIFLLCSYFGALLLVACLGKDVGTVAEPAQPDDIKVVDSPADPQIELVPSFITRFSNDCTLSQLKHKPTLILGVGAATAVGWSNTGQFIAVSSTNGTYLYDVNENRQIDYIDTSARKISKIVFSPDDKLIVLGGPDGLITIYDIMTRSIKPVIRAYNLVGSHDDNKRIKDLFFSKDGDYLVALMEANHAIVLWKAPDFQRVFLRNNVEAESESVIFINQGIVAVVGLGIRIIRISDSAILTSHDIKGTDPLQGWAVFNTTGRWEDTLVAIGSRDGFVKILRLEKWQLTKNPYSLQSKLKYPQLMFTPDGKYLLAYSPKSTTIEVWDVQTGEIVQSLEASQAAQTRFADIDPISQIQFSSDGRYLIAMGASIHVWNTESWTEAYSSLLIELTNAKFDHQDVYYDHYKPDYPYYYDYHLVRFSQREYKDRQPPHFEVSMQNGRLAYVTPYYRVEAIQIETKQPLVKDQLSWFNFFAKIEYQPEAYQIGMRGSDDLTRIWDVRYVNHLWDTSYATVEQISADVSKTQKPEHITWPGKTAQNGDLVATLDDLGIFELKKGTQRVLRQNTSPGLEITFSPDGSYLLSTHVHGRIIVRRGSDGKNLFELHEPAEIEHMMFSPNGRYFITYGYGNLSDGSPIIKFIHIYKVPESGSDQKWENVGKNRTILDDGVFGAPIGFWPDPNTIVLERGHNTHPKGPALVRLSDATIVRDDWPTGELSISGDGTFLQLLNPGKGTIEIWGCEK